MRHAWLPTMRLSALAGSLAFVCLVASARDASACGAPFGRDTTVKPEQTIVVSYANGEERYELNPAFCGKGADFGLVLPIPAAPSKPVALGDPELRSQLDALSGPQVITTTHRYCPSDSGGGDGALGGVPNRGAVDGDGTKNGSQGVDVVDAGTVGFLDYEIIKAESDTSLTAYLDQNQFPYDQSARSAFSQYVALGWHFVAFKVSAGPTAPPAGQQLCGSVGPLVVSFPATQPVIPTRIITASALQRWRIYAVADQNREPTSAAANLTLSKSFSGPITSEDLTHYPALSTIARAGQRITRHEIQFYGSQNPGDLLLTVAKEPQSDHRLTEYRTESVPDEDACSGCAVASTSGGDDPRTRQGLAAVLAVGLAIFLAKRRSA